MKKCFFLIGVLTVGLISSCIGDEEPSPNHSSKQEVTPSSPAVPAWVKDLKWDEISDSDFTLSEDGTTLLEWNNKNITHLDMNRNARLKKVKTIAKEPFKGCDKLTAMVLSDEVETLADECFDGPDNLERIHLANVRTIGEEAFKGQEKLKELHLPMTIENINDEFHVLCYNLEVLTIPDNHPKYKTIDNVLFDKDMKTLISCPPNYQGKSTFKVPEGVTRLGLGAFSDCSNIKEIVCPQSLVEIGEYSFDTDRYSDRRYVVHLATKQIVKVNFSREEDEYHQNKLSLSPNSRILVPKELLAQYKSDKVWSEIADQIEAL